MIGDDSMFIYLMFQLLLFVFTLIGYFRLPILLVFTVSGTLLISVQTINAFGTYWEIAILIILINMTVPVYGLIQIRKGD